jgi:hypothetical protein
MIVSNPSHRIRTSRKMPAMIAMQRIRFLSTTGEGLKAQGRMESSPATLLNIEKIIPMSFGLGPWMFYQGIRMIFP